VKVPTVSLNEMGPFYDLVVRRSQLPSGDMWKAAIQKDKRYRHPSTSQRVIKEPCDMKFSLLLARRIKPAKVKNVKRSALGDKLGRIHMKPQNLDNMGGRRVDALRNNGSKKRRPASGGDSDGSSKKKARA
jgi:ribosome production factor 2